MSSTKLPSPLVVAGRVSTVDSKPRVLAIIPARAGSKRVPGKNIRELGGTPLIGWTIRAAIEAISITDVVVSTDSESIANVARAFGASVPFLRSEELAGDLVPTYPVVVDALERSGELSPDLVVVLQPTSPFRDADDIDRAVRAFCGFDGIHSLVSVRQIPHSCHPDHLLEIDSRGLSRKRVVPSSPEEIPRFARNGPAIIITKPETLAAGSLYGDKTLGFTMEEYKSVDIDKEFDFSFAEWLLEKQPWLGARQIESLE